jgi:hypothetical protein
MKRSTLQQHKEVTMLCEEVMTIVEARSALLIPQSIKYVVPTKTQNNTGKIDKHYTNCRMTNHNVKICKKKEKIDHDGNHRGDPTKLKSIEDIFICMSHVWFEWP